MTDNDYRIEERFEKGRPNYTLSSRWPWSAWS